MAKETKYSWHLSLRVDRPVEVRFFIGEGPFLFSCVSQAVLMDHCQAPIPQLGLFGKWLWRGWQNEGVDFEWVVLLEIRETYNQMLASFFFCVDFCVCTCECIYDLLLILFL